jgi:HSP20 family protein
MARFFYSDPYALRGALEQILNPPVGSRQEHDTPIPVDVYQDGNEIVIEGAVPGARLEDLELTCEDGLLTVRGQVVRPQHDYAVQEIPRGSFSRTLALPTDCQVKDASASFQDGILRIVLPKSKATVAHTIRIETPNPSRETARIVMEKNDGDIVDAVKGEDYREIDTKSARRRGRASK